MKFSKDYLCNAAFFQHLEQQYKQPVKAKSAQAVQLKCLQQETK